MARLHGTTMFKVSIEITMARLHGTTVFKVSIEITIWQDYMVPLCSRLV